MAARKLHGRPGQRRKKPSPPVANPPPVILIDEGELPYLEAVGKEILRRVSMGETLRSVCRSEGMPHESGIRHWIREDRRGFAQRYALAKICQLDVWAEELTDIADDGTNDWVERWVQGRRERVVDREHIERSKLRIDTRKWLLSKLKPGEFGERLQAVLTFDVTERLEAARQRVLSG